MWIENILIVVGFVLLLIVLIYLDNKFTDEKSKWNRAAGIMRIEGYTELEIYHTLGPCPESENDKK